MLKYYTERPNSPGLDKIPTVPMIHGQVLPVSPESQQKSLWQKKYAEYWQRADAIAQRVSLADADVVILPYDWYWFRGPHWLSKQHAGDYAAAVKAANQVVYQAALAAGKPAVLFFTGDRSHEPTPFPAAITFREGIYASRSNFRDFCLPAFTEDLARQIPEEDFKHRHGEIVLREKHAVPTVGFCGLAPTPTLQDRVIDVAYYGLMLLRQGCFDTSPHAGERLRCQALKALEASPAVATNFIKRDRSVFLGVKDQQQKRQVRQEFINNMIDSDYMLCCRGSGNFSFRLYETLCMGRIPVVIDTDSRFPYDFHVNWRQHCLFVERSQIAAMGERIREHYAGFSAQSYCEQQLAARRFWQEYLSPQGFFEHFGLHFDKARHAHQAVSRRHLTLANSYGQG